MNVVSPIKIGHCVGLHCIEVKTFAQSIKPFVKINTKKNVREQPHFEPKNQQANTKQHKDAKIVCTIIYQIPV